MTRSTKPKRRDFVTKKGASSNPVELRSRADGGFPGPLTTEGDSGGIGCSGCVATDPRFESGRGSLPLR
jgi:hypothetical protein